MLATFITLHFPICFTTAFLATGWFTSSRCPYVASATPARAKLRRSGISGQGTPFASTAESAEQEWQKSILKELNYRKKYVSKAIISEWDCMRLYCFNLDSGSNDDQTSKLQGPNLCICRRHQNRLVGPTDAEKGQDLENSVLPSSWIPCDANHTSWTEPCRRRQSQRHLEKGIKIGKEPWLVSFSVSFISMSSCFDTTKNIAWLHITWRLDLYTAVSNDHCQGIQSWQLNCLVRSILKFKTLGNAANQQLRQCSEPSMNRTCILRWLHTRQRSACSLKPLSKPSYFHKESANHANQRVSDNWDIFSKFFCTTSRDWSKFAFIPREWGEWQLTGRQVYAVVQAHVDRTISSRWWVSAPIGATLSLLPTSHRSGPEAKWNKLSFSIFRTFLWHFMSGIFECFQPVRPPSLCNAKRTLGVFA